MSYNNVYTDSASYYLGGEPTGILVIIHRRHWLAKHGHYLLTVMYPGYPMNHNAVTDDYGNLLVVGRTREVAF